MLLGTTDQSGVPLCACRLLNVAHTGVDKLSLQYDVSHVFIDIFRRGRRFYRENIEFPCLVFCESAGELSGTILVPLRLSGATRGPLMLSQALLVTLSGARRPQRGVSKVSLVGLCQPLRNMRLHVLNPHCAPFPGAQKQDRKRDMSKTHQNSPERPR